MKEIPITFTASTRLEAEEVETLQRLKRSGDMDAYFRYLHDNVFDSDDGIWEAFYVAVSDALEKA